MIFHLTQYANNNPKDVSYNEGNALGFHIAAPLGRSDFRRLKFYRILNTEY